MGKSKRGKGTGRNDACPCGSGKKYKKCCLHRKESREATYTGADREMMVRAFHGMLDDPAFAEMVRECEQLFWGDWLERRHELPPDALAACNLAFTLWVCLDRRLTNGQVPAERLAEAPNEPHDVVALEH